MTFWGDEERLVLFIYLVFFSFGNSFSSREQGFGLFWLYIICEPAEYLTRSSDIGALKSCCSGIRLGLSCLKRHLYGNVTLTISATCAGNYTTVFCAGHPL